MSRLRCDRDITTDAVAFTHHFCPLVVAAAYFFLSLLPRSEFFFFFFFNDPAPPEIYPLSLHDALPIYPFLRHVVVHLASCPYLFQYRIAGVLGPEVYGNLSAKRPPRLRSSNYQRSFARFGITASDNNQIGRAHV